MFTEAQKCSYMLVLTSPLTNVRSSGRKHVSVHQGMYHPCFFQGRS